MDEDQDPADLIDMGWDDGYVASLEDEHKHHKDKEEYHRNAMNFHRREIRRIEARLAIVQKETK